MAVFSVNAAGGAPMKHLFRYPALALCCTAAVLAAAPAALAQEEAAAGDEQAERAEAPVDEIVVIGPKMRRDRAMDAFLRGDFETAELEFGKNARCVQRLESQRKWAHEQFVSDSITAEMLGNAGGPSAGQRQPSVSPSYQGPPASPTRTPKRTCEDEAFQLYMQALSLLQLGRYAEAKKLFYRVIALRKDISVYDAHYRIGLLEVVAGDLKKANDRLAHLKTLQKRCRRIGDKCEVADEIDESIIILASAIENYEQAPSG